MKVNADITSKRLIVVKGWLMLLCGLLGAGLLIVLHPEWTTVVLVAATVFGFCRFYYFLFYVIERYVDPEYRFAGITHAIRHLWRRGSSGTPR